MHQDPAPRHVAPPLRVLLIARHSLARAGLRGVLSELDGVEIVGEAATSEQAVDLARTLQPDLALADWESGVAGAPAALVDRLNAAGTPLVVLGDAPGASELSAALRAGVRGVLLTTESVEDVGAALEAVARGFVVLDPLLGQILPEATPVALPEGLASIEQLTEREREVLQLLALGLPNKAIARRLNVTEHTAKFHVGSILAKLGAVSRTEAVTRAARQGLLAL